MAATRKNKMPHWKNRRNKSFPMKTQTVTCGQCGKSVSKKQTHAVHVTYGKAFNRSKEQSYRKSKPTDNTAPRKQFPTPVVTAVKRVCRAGCS